jgi:hypothetical protein
MASDPLSQAEYDDSWEWFEDFRDENSDLVGSVSPQRDIPERERIEGYLKSPFKTPVDSDGEYEQTDFGALIGSYAEIAEAIRATSIEVLAEQYLDFARGQQLEQIGEEVDIQRWNEESDESLRRRIRARFRQIISAGTIDEIRESVAELLDTDSENVEMVEEFEYEVATFDIDLPESAIDESPISESYLHEHVQGMKAAGVEYRSAPRAEPGWFEFRSEEEYDDDPDDTDLGPERGFGAGGWYGGPFLIGDWFQFQSEDSYEDDSDDSEHGSDQGWDAGQWYNGPF